MKILIFWDIYGRIGRKAFFKHFPDLRNQYAPDFVLVNVENMSSGRGPIQKHLAEFDAVDGIDVYTSGNHIFDHYDEVEAYLDSPESKLIRPANFYEHALLHIPGKWYKIVEKNGYKILVINLMSQVFLHQDVYNPFLKIHELLASFELSDFHAIMIDFHKETTSEWQALTLFVDGKVSFVYGTHTHIQTNDDTIFPQWTGMLNDVGMTGPMWSAIGQDFWEAQNRFLWWVGYKLTQSLNRDYVVSGCCVEIDPTTRKCTHIEKIRLRGTL